jgi:hypothetical protein
VGRYTINGPYVAANGVVQATLTVPAGLAVQDSFAVQAVVLRTTNPAFTSVFGNVVVVDCLAGTTQDSTTICGFNDEGVYVHACPNGAWEDTSTCTGTDLCTNGVTQSNPTTGAPEVCIDGAWSAAPGLPALTMQSTVSHTYNQGGGLSGGIAVNDSVTFALDWPIANASSGTRPGFECSSPIIDCESIEWTFPPAPYTLTYSSGYTQTGTIDRLEIINGSVDVFMDTGWAAPPQNVEDAIKFYSGNTHIWEALDFEDTWRITSIPTDLDAAMVGIDAPAIFDLTFYWGTYHYDYIKPQRSTVVSLP